MSDTDLTKKKKKKEVCGGELNKSIANKEIKLVINNFPQTKVRDQRTSLMKSIKHLKN